MGMMFPPDAPPGLPIPPGGGEPMMGGPAPPRDELNQMPLPGEGGIDGLLAALGGGGGAPPEGGLPPGDNTLGGTAPEDDQELDSVGHIQQAMKHLMMAMAKDEDDERGHGIVKGMGALQSILGGEQKANRDAHVAGLK